MNSCIRKSGSLATDEGDAPVKLAASLQWFTSSVNGPWVPGIENCENRRGEGELRARFLFSLGMEPC